jgi:hypothetical protein
MYHPSQKTDPSDRDSAVVSLLRQPFSLSRLIHRDLLTLAGKVRLTAGSSVVRRMPLLGALLMSGTTNMVLLYDGRVWPNDLSQPALVKFESEPV